jgi:hypothetical protein
MKMEKSMVKVARNQLADLLNEDLSPEYQAIIAYLRQATGHLFRKPLNFSGADRGPKISLTAAATVSVLVRM